MSALVAGLGCRSGVSVETLCIIVDTAMREAGKQPSDLALIAAPDFKEDARFGIAAKRLGVPLVYVDRPALAQAQQHCLTRSSIAERIVGISAVAEAAALAAAGPGAQLLGPRIALDGATCALARKAAP